MAKRSVRITLSNNTEFDLKLLASDLGGGEWTDPWQPPQVIHSKTHGGWQSESGGIMTGTEGWVKYVTDTTGTSCPQELVYIHWNNPYIWAEDTKPIDWKVSTSDGGPDTCPHELFGYSASGGGPPWQGVTWWDLAVNWWALLGLSALGQNDLNLEFIIGLRQQDSIRQTIFSFYDGSKGLRSLASTAKQPSLRKLFHM